MRWPFMTKAEHDKVVAAIEPRLGEAIAAIRAEHARATKDGMAKVHTFMREANANVFTSNRPEIACRAVFQQAEREFRPDPHPLTLSEGLYAPANVKEAIDRAAATA